MINLKLRIKSHISVSAIVAIVSACGIDQNDAKYDQLRFDKLQGTNCAELAKIASEPFIVKKPEKYEVLLGRCQRLKSLSFGDYERVAGYARKTGEWDVDAALRN